MSIISGGNYIPISSNFNIVDEMNKYFTCISKSNYPKYNIIYVDTSNIYIEIALAGFSKENLKILKNESEITIIGSDNLNYVYDNTHHNKIQYLVKNISARNFSLYFYLKPNIKVHDVKFENGMLYIYLNLKAFNNINYIEIK